MAKQKKGKKKRTKKQIPEKKKSKKKKITAEDKILKNFFIGIAIVVFLIVLIILISNSSKTFEYKGVEFRTVKEGDLTLYKTSIPVRYQGKKIPYNFYLRNDPRILVKTVAFEENITLKKNIVINSTKSFNCDGDGIIGIANLQILYEISGIKMIKDENATCDSEGKYTFIQLQEGNETSIEKFGPSCYRININNCEVLKATERLMLEYLVKINDLISSSE